MESDILLNGLQTKPCIRKKRKEIIFLLNPLIKLKNTKHALVVEGIESFSNHIG